MCSHIAVGTETSAPTDGTSAMPNDGSSGAHDSLGNPVTDISCGEKALSQGMVVNCIQGLLWYLHSPHTFENPVLTFNFKLF